MKPELKRAISNIRRKGPFTRGLLGDFDGNIAVSGRPGYNYVRVEKPGGYEVGIFPGRVRALYNLPVRVETHPVTGVQYIAGVDDETIAYAGVDPGDVAMIDPHADSHAWGGSDMLMWLHTNQLYPLRCQPHPTTNNYVVIQPGAYYAESTFCVLADTLTVDLTGYVPATGRKYVLLYLDAVGVAGVSDTSALQLSEVVPLTTGEYMVAIVRLRATASLGWQDVVDLRYMMQNPGLLLSFLALTDTPDDYADDADKLLTVNDAEDAIEFRDYIDNLNSVQFNLSPTVTAEEQGLLWWNPEDGTLNLGMTDGADVIQQIGQESYYFVKNQTGYQLDNGKVLRAVGTVGASGRITADYAIADGTHDAMYAIGVATEDIANGEDGLVTEFGLVRGIDTTGTPYSETWADGDVLYLSDTVAGGLTNIRPTAPHLKIPLAFVIYANANGSMMVRIQTGYTLDDLHNVSVGDGEDGDLLQWDDTDNRWENIDPVTAVLPYLGAIDNEPTGFPNRTDSTISFVDGIRTFTIAPAAPTFDYYISGVKYTVDTGDDLVIADTTGIHVIYYDGDTLSEAVNPAIGDVDVIIRTKAIVAIIYWNATASEAIYVGEERHGITMDGVTHAYLHYTNGLVYLNGLGLTDILADENGSLDTHAQFGVSAGGVSDEDIYDSITAILATAGLNIYYMTGTGVWNRTTYAGFSVVKTGAVGGDRLAYNQYTGGAWQLTEVTNNDFVLCHVFATTEKDNPIIAIVGQNEYGTAGQARTGAQIEIRELLLNDVLFPEIRPLATVIFQTSDSYSNAPQARIISTDDGDDYIDWRNEEISRVALTTDDHNALAGLQGGSAGEYYHLTSVEEAAATRLATTTQSGLLTELATDAETQTGTDTERAVTPAGLRADVPATPAASRGVRLDSNGNVLLPSGGDVLPDGATDVVEGVDARLEAALGPREIIGTYGYNIRQSVVPDGDWALGTSDGSVRDDFYVDNYAGGISQWAVASSATPYGTSIVSPSWMQIISKYTGDASPTHAILYDTISGHSNGDRYCARMFSTTPVTTVHRVGIVTMDTAQNKGAAMWLVADGTGSTTLVYATYYDLTTAWMSHAGSTNSSVAYTTSWTVRYTSSSIDISLRAPMEFAIRYTSISVRGEIIVGSMQYAQLYSLGLTFTPNKFFIFLEGNLAGRGVLLVDWVGRNII